MNAYFDCVQLIGGNFDIEHSTLIAKPTTEAGVALFFSACALYPPSGHIRHWCSLARVANGAPIDCMLWHGEGENRKPVGAIRIRYRSDHGETR